MKCAKCGKEFVIKAPGKEGAKVRLPRGWKRQDENTVTCEKCWNESYVISAVTFPVVGPLDKKLWPAFRQALNDSWKQSTQMSNWAATELLKADVVRGPDLEKLPASPKVYLYPGSTKLYPGLVPSTRVSLLNLVTRKYNSERFERIWLGARSASSYRFPTPIPIPAAAWSVRWLSEDQHVPIVRLRLGNEPFEVQLRGGPEFRHQLNKFTEIVEGLTHPCEMQIYQQTVHENSNRSGLTQRGSGGGQKVKTRIMFKLVGWFPRTVHKHKEKHLLVTTRKDSFWEAVVEGADPWLYHADHVRRWVMAHSHRLQRLSDDQKFEHRRTSNERIPINEYRERMVQRQHDRLKSFMHESTALLVNFCLRQCVTHLEYDASEHSYLPSFPWFQLDTLLQQKCKANGIELTLKLKEAATVTHDVPSEDTPVAMPS